VVGPLIQYQQVSNVTRFHHRHRYQHHHQQVIAVLLGPLGPCQNQKSNNKSPVQLQSSARWQNQLTQLEPVLAALVA
jgi:hypothetical protein